MNRMRATDVGVAVDYDLCSDEDDSDDEGCPRAPAMRS